MRPLFDRLIAILASERDFDYKIGKTYIGLLHTLVFAAIRVQTEKMVVEFTIRHEIDSPRIVRALHFQRQRWAYFVVIRDPSDIDSELVDWIRQSYE
jgi:predicted DNA-binding protein (MmcQ/YjbR family)